MKNSIKIITIIFSSILLFIMSACGSTSSVGTDVSEVQKLSPVDFIDYTSGDIPIWANRPYVPSTQNYKQIDRGENLSLDITVGGQTKTAYKKIVHDCKNLYTGNINNEIYFCVHTKYTKEELSQLLNQGYNTIVYYLYLEAEGTATGMLDMMRATFDNVKASANSVSFLVYFNTWNRVEYPLKWFVENYDKLNGQKLFLYPYQVKLLPTVYTFYFGKMTLEKI